MQIPSNPANETARLAALRGLRILDTPPEERFDRITRIAAKLFNLPIALVSLVDENRQWFKSRQGLAADETGRDISFCGHAILQDDVFVIDDALADPRFSDNPLVTGQPLIRFYAGAPLSGENGAKLGTLCIIDRKPRHFSEQDRAALQALATWAERELAVASEYQTVASELENKVRLAAIMENIVDGIITISDRGMIESINPAGERIFGYRADELAGRNVNILMPEPYHSAHDGYLRNYLESGSKKIIGIGREVTGRRKDGSVFPLYLAVSEMLINGKRGFTGIVRDITERKEAERQLQERTELMRAILDSANYTIISTDENGLIRTFNRGAERMLGYAAEEVVGKTTPAILHDPQEVAQRAGALSTELGRAIAPGFEVFVAKARLGTPDENEWTYIRRDGSRFPVLLSVTALNNAQGNISGFVGIGYDLTDRNEMEQVKKEFVSTVSHELRTPLTSIMGSLGIVTSGVSGNLPPELAPLVGIAHKNAARLVRLINDILDIDKIESGKMHFDMHTLELMPLVAQAIEANRDYAAQHGVKLTLESGLPGARVKVDSDRLAQVLANLLSNAAKFSPRGADVTVNAAQHESWIRISIKDRGPGISPEFKSRIFQKFSQADSSDSRQKGGTGLGLNITKAIVEHMAGRISFDSRPGSGATFHVDLPEAASAFMPAPPPASTIQADGTRVLICEDDHDVALLLQLMLKQAGYVADVSRDAEQAKHMLRERPYAALTLDIALPDQNGIDLIRELRAMDDTRHLPIIVVSANIEHGRQVLSGGIAIVDWIAKPIDQRRLLLALKQTIGPGLARPLVLHVEDDPDIIKIVNTLLDPHCDVECATTLSAARRALQHRPYDLVILDMILPDGSGSDLLPQVNALKAPPPVLVFSATELPQKLPDTIAAALVKSQTGNDKLLQTIRRLTRQPGT